MDLNFHPEKAQTIENLCKAVSEHRLSGLKRFPTEVKTRITDLIKEGIPIPVLAQELKLQPTQLQNWLKNETRPEEISVFDVSESMVNPSLKIEAGGFRLSISRI